MLEAVVNIRPRYSNPELSQISSLGPDIAHGTLAKDGRDATFLHQTSDKYKNAEEVECTLGLQDLAGWQSTISLGKWKIAKTPAAQATAEIKPNVQLPLKLRSTPEKNLTEDEVRSMIKKYDFYCRGDLPWSNPNGKGLANDFLSQQNGQVILDRATGLMWQQSGSSNSVTSDEAPKYVTELNRQKFAGFSDWHLPTLEEALSLMQPMRNGDLYIDAKFGAKQRWIWTSDIYSAGRAWSVSFYAGDCVHHYIGFDPYVRAVRSGQ